MSCDFRILWSFFYSQTNNDIRKNLTRINSNWKHYTSIFLCLLWPHPLDLPQKPHKSRINSWFYSLHITWDFQILNKPKQQHFWANMICRVCQNPKASSHSYYGATSICPSCRGFFMRSVQSQEKVAKVVGSKNVFQSEWRPVTLWHMKKSSKC